KAEGSWVPPAHYAACLALAILMRSLVRRIGPSRRLSACLLLFDLIAFNAVTVEFAIFQPGQMVLHPEDSALWFAYSAPANILLILVVNTLRSDRDLAIAGGILGIATLYVAAALSVAVIAQQLVATILIAGAATVGAVAAERRR